MAQYRFQQEYLERLRQQQIYLRDHRFDYDNDPYFYTPPIYRYNRGSMYYQINEYGARALRQAVRYGYEEGFRAGIAGHDDRSRFQFRTLIPIGTQLPLQRLFPKPGRLQLLFREASGAVMRTVTIAVIDMAASITEIIPSWRRF